MALMQEIYQSKKIFLDIEKPTKKCVHRLNGAIEFNKTCLTNGIFPKYCHIYIYFYCIIVVVVNTRMIIHVFLHMWSYIFIFVLLILLNATRERIHIFVLLVFKLHFLCWWDMIFFEPSLWTVCR